VTTKNPTKWLPQPNGYGYVTTVTANNLIDQSSNQLVDQAGNALITGTTQVVGKTAITWSNTGV
jgi:hypothetical protein